MHAPGTTNGRFRFGRRTLLACAAVALIVPAALGGIAVASTAQKGPPVNTEPPSIAGGAREGVELVARNGRWTGTKPLNFTYLWRRCNEVGRACQTIPGATSSTYTLTADEVTSSIRVLVTATNTAGSVSVVSGPTNVVTPGAGGGNSGGGGSTAGPAGTIKLADGRTSVPVTSVTPPHRLVITGIQFAPNPVRSRNPFSARFTVTDTRGFVVRGALVYVVGLPYGRIGQAPEATTDTDGVATMQLQPTSLLPLQNGYSIVMFVRARKQGDSLLSGISTRRLVQVRVGAPV